MAAFSITINVGTHGALEKRLAVFMLKHFSYLLLAFSIFASTSLFACDENVACDKCAKESEFSWNPNNQFVTARLSRFYSLDDKIAEAYKANDFDKVKELAKENLELAAVYRCNWNFGNAIHDANRVLGLVSLKGGDIDAAEDYLLEAGKSTGSPQLDTFGPELDLANELLQIGKVDAVKSYLKDIKSFWEMNNGQVDTWLAEIEKGGKPQLDRFAGNKPGPLLMALFWMATAWPFIVSAAFVYAQRKRITRKLLFFIIAVPSGYAVMYVGNWIVGYVVQAIMSGMEDLSETTLLLISYLPLGLVLLLPVLTVFLLARFFHSNVSK
jgi:hypothetical protein